MKKNNLFRYINFVWSDRFSSTKKISRIDKKDMTLKIDHSDYCQSAVRYFVCASLNTAISYRGHTIKI